MMQWTHPAFSDLLFSSKSLIMSLRDVLMMSFLISRTLGHFFAELNTIFLDVNVSTCR